MGRFGVVVAAITAVAAGCGLDTACESEAAAPCDECPAGALRWAQAYRGGVDAYVAGLVVDACQAPIAAGRMLVDRRLHGARATVVKYEGTGTLEWVDVDARPGDATWQSIATNGHTVFVAGRRERDPSRTFDDTYGVVAAFDADGAPRWERILPDEGDAAASSVFVLGNGRLLVGGVTTGAGWLRIYAEDGSLELESTDVTRIGKIVAVTPDDEIVVDQPREVVWLDATLAEIGRASVTQQHRTVASADGRRVVGLTTISGLEVFEMRPGAPPSPWFQQDPAALVVVAALVLDDEIVLGGFEKRDGQERRAVHAYARDGTHLWSFSDDGGAPGRVDALAAGPNGLVYAAGTTESTQSSTFTDQDLWIGGLER